MISSHTIFISRSRISNSDSAISNGYSDNSDEAESRFVILETNGSPDYSDDAESLNILGSQVLELSSETNHGYHIGDVSHVPVDWGDSHLNLGYYQDANANDGEVDHVSHDTDVDTTCSHDFYLTGKDTSHEQFGTLNNPSKVDCEKILELGKHFEYVLTDNFHVGDCGESLFSSRVDAYAPSDNIGAKHEPYVGEVGSNIDEPSSHEKTNHKALSSELLVRNSCFSVLSENPNLLYSGENQESNACTEVVNIGGNSCFDGLKNGNVTSVDEASQLSSHEEQSPYPGDYDGHSCNSSTLLAVKSNGNDHHLIPAKSVAPSETSIPSFLGNDTVFCSDLHCSMVKNDKELLDGNKITPDYTEQISYNGFMSGNASNSLDIPNKELTFSPCMAVGGVNSSTDCSKDCHDAMERSEDHKALVESVDGKPIDIDSTVLVHSVATVLCDPRQEAESPKFVDDSNQKHLQCVKDVEKGASELVNQEGTDKEIPVHKPQRTLLQSVVKGTALLGVAVFLLHIRKNRQKNLSEAKKQPTHIVIQGATMPSQKDHKGGSTSSIYPAEKLHFGYVEYKEHAR